MQKITEIKEQHIIKRRETVNGVNTFVEKNYIRFHPVKFVEGLPRVGHFLLDRVFFYIFAIIIGVPVAIILVMMGISIDDNSASFKLFDTLFSWLILQPLYYFIFEALIQSSPAKIILGRIVVDEYGNKPGIKQIFIRSISRSVPFEAFSCLSTTGWHDNWSKTYVIRKKDLRELRLLQKINNIQEPISPNEPKV
jgi:uncharacterized RDD family membrane protein YckC